MEKSEATFKAGWFSGMAIQISKPFPPAINNVTEIRLPTGETFQTITETYVLDKSSQNPVYVFSS